LRKAKVGKKTSKKEKGEKKEKKEMPPQLKAWQKEVDAVMEEYEEKGKKITRKEAISIASKRRKDAKGDDSDSEDEKPKKKASKKSKKDDSDDEDEKPKKKKSKKAESDSEDEKPKKKSKKAAESDDEEEKPKKKSKKAAESDDEEEKPKKKAKKEVKEEPKEETEDGGLTEWTYEGTTYFKSSMNELWLVDGDKLGKWVGVYNSVEDEIDTSAPEPDVQVE
jgi:DNA mismatch repair ATPase MutL